MKKLISLFIIVVFVFCLASCDKTKDELVENYPSLDKTHVYEVINASTFLQKVDNKETFVALFAFPSCPWCQACIGVLNERAKVNGIDKVYYLYLKEMRDDENHQEHADYLKIYDYFVTYGADDAKKERINAPTVVAIVDGKITGYHLDTVDSHQMVDGVLPPMTDEELNSLKIIYDYLLLQTK